MNNKALVQYYFQHHRSIQKLSIFIISALIGLVTVLVWQTGGIKFVYSHSMYIPILLAGFVLGLPGGVFFALVAGIALGPWMPIDTVSGEMQQPINWIYRTGYFVLIGGLSGAMNDSLRRYIEYLSWLAKHDVKTGLPNRKSLLEHIRGLKRKSRLQSHSQSQFVLMLINIDNVRGLEGAFGFKVTDRIIKVFASFLVGNLPEKTRIYRTDTDQLAILMAAKNVNSEQLVQHIVALLKESVSFDSYSIYVPTHVGATIIGETYETPETYLQQAGLALASAYSRQRDYTQFSKALETNAQRNITLLGDLQNALRLNQLSIHYQPKIDLKSNTVCGVEALIRWQHPLYGNIPPSDFIPQAEQSTLILHITAYVVQQVTEQIVAWRAAGIELPVAINVSSHDITDNGFVTNLLVLLERSEIQGNLIEIELTEGALIHNLEQTQVELLRLSKARITISVDDFGTGYSSLQYMHRLPISVIKIDKSFVSDLPNDNGAKHIVNAAITLAKNMGIKTIAEGVETPAVATYLKEINCDFVQGFYYSKPLPEDEFVSWYRAYQAINA